MTISENKITEFYEYLISEEKSPKIIEKNIRDTKKRIASEFMPTHSSQD